MNHPENENTKNTATVEPPEAATKSAAKSAPNSRKILGLVAAAFLVGVAGTAAVTSRHTAAPAAQPAEAAIQPNENLQSPALIKIEAAAAQNAGIKTRLVTLAPLTITMTVPGTVEANPSGQAKITPPVAGKLARILVNLGDTVRKGQPLAVLDSYDVAQAHAAVRDAALGVGQAVAAVQIAQAQTGQARAKLGSAQTTLERQRQLAQAGSFSQAPLLAAQSEVSQAQSELTQAQTELRIKIAATQRAGRLIQDRLISKSELEQTQADQQQTEARVKQATTRVALAKQALARERKVYGGDLLSKQAVQSAQADVGAAQAEVQTSLSQTQAAGTSLQSARGRVTAAQNNLSALEGGGHTAGGAGLVTLYAPLGGVITEKSATLGETVERSTALMTISGTNTVLVQANVTE
nr:efflux RND transporter periplasmic adaptor subunit [Armatimonadota bacterium]